jgi:hypothetical protein
MRLILFLISFSISYGMILYSQKYVKNDLRVLKILLIILGSIPILDIILSIIIIYHFYIANLLRFEVLEYVDEE